MEEPTLSFVLRKIGSAVDQLIELAERKAGVILEGDTRGLDDVVCSEGELSHMLASLEEERQAAAGRSLTEDPGDIEILRAALREKADRLKALNERNQRLLKQGLDIVEFELKLFMPQPSYKGAPAKGPVLFDHRV